MKRDTTEQAKDQFLKCTAGYHWSGRQSEFEASFIEETRYLWGNRGRLGLYVSIISDMCLATERPTMLP